LSTGAVLKRGLHRRCAVCGQKKLFRRWVIMVERCPRCGLRFQRDPGQWLGSWFLNICLAQLVVIVVLIVGVATGRPGASMVALGIIGALAACLFPLWFFPYSRTIWVAIDLAMRPLEFSEGVDPAWELEGDRRLLFDDRRLPHNTVPNTDAAGRVPPAESEADDGGSVG
jgi:uncharacterized protein (DUF983 family)